MSESRFQGQGLLIILTIFSGLQTGFTMRRSLLFTFIANDKPGIVDLLSRIVADNDGNWLSSRLTRLGGKFAGVVQISIPEQNLPVLNDQLQALAAQQIAVLLGDSSEVQTDSTLKTTRLSILGLDRPGIVREIAQALAERQINVVEMHSSLESAAMTGEPLFRAEVSIQLPANASTDELTETLENIANRLDIDWQLE